MKIDFIENYQIWDLKKIDLIKEKIFKTLPISDELELDVRGCAFDYLSAPELVKLAVSHLHGSGDGNHPKHLTLIFEKMTSPAVSSEFFGALVDESTETQDLSALIERWSEKEKIHILLIRQDTSNQIEIIAEYGTR